jgi:hypothetical protein
MAELKPLFDGVFLAGFECSCHALEDGARLDMTKATRHDTFAHEDYGRLAGVGITAARDGVQWVKAAQHDFSSALPIVRAANTHRVQVIWDLMHFGWPADVDVFSVAFVRRFGKYARAFAEWLRDESDMRPMITPVNEMSFLAWAGGDVRVMNPFQAARGVELKVQLVRATIEAIDAVRSVLPRARFVQPEPVIRIHARPEQWKTHRRVESDNLLQYQAWDMLTGRVFSQLGGHERYLDIIGVNFYSDNQFTPEGDTVHRHEARYQPFSRMLLDVWSRYRRPMLISETGAEGDARAEWLRYVCSESLTALQEGVELHGITLYPILNHPGWVDGRHCPNGLWDYADDAGDRHLYEPLATEVRARARALIDARRAMLVRHA